MYLCRLSLVCLKTDGLEIYSLQAGIDEILEVADNGTGNGKDLSLLGPWVL